MLSNTVKINYIINSETQKLKVSLLFPVHKTWILGTNLCMLFLKWIHPHQKWPWVWIESNLIEASVNVWCGFGENWATMWVTSSHGCDLTNSFLVQWTQWYKNKFSEVRLFSEFRQSYIPSTLNIELILCHTQLVVCAVNC